MTATEDFLQEHRFWLQARGYSDKGLQNPGVLDRYLMELERNINIVMRQEGNNKKCWRQEMSGTFKEGKYPLDLSLDYTYHPRTGSFRLNEIRGSMFGHPAQHYHLPEGRLQYLPSVKDVFNKVLVEFVIKTQVKITQIRNQTRSIKPKKGIQ